MGDQSVSLIDPITFSRIEDPVRGVYCRHLSCFDAQCFFRIHVTSRVWKCPQCSVQMKGIHELYIDYEMKKALHRYPNHERLILRDGVLLPDDIDFSLKKPKLEYTVDNES